MKSINLLSVLLTLLLTVGCAISGGQAEKSAQEKLKDYQATEKAIQKTLDKQRQDNLERQKKRQARRESVVNQKQLAAAADYQKRLAAADKERQDNLEREKRRQARIQEENRKKKESKVQTYRKIHVSQQQLAVDQVYDREFRVFLRARNYPNVSGIVASSRKYNNFWRDNPNASGDNILSFWNTLSKHDQSNILEIETPEFKELWSEFGDDLAQRYAQQQYAQRQLAIKSITENPITIGPDTGYRNPVIIINNGLDSNPNGYSRACGFKPFPQLGCQIGRCVNGVWEQVCR